MNYSEAKKALDKRLNQIEDSPVVRYGLKWAITGIIMAALVYGGYRLNDWLRWRDIDLVWKACGVSPWHKFERINGESPLVEVFYCPKG